MLFHKFTANSQNCGSMILCNIVVLVVCTATMPCSQPITVTGYKQDVQQQSICFTPLRTAAILLLSPLLIADYIISLLL